MVEFYQTIFEEKLYFTLFFVRLMPLNQTFSESTRALHRDRTRSHSIGGSCADIDPMALDRSAFGLIE